MTIFSGDSSDDIPRQSRAIDKLNKLTDQDHFVSPGDMLFTKFTGCNSVHRHLRKTPYTQDGEEFPHMIETRAANATQFSLLARRKNWGKKLICVISFRKHKLHIRLRFGNKEIIHQKGYGDNILQALKDFSNSLEGKFQDLVEYLAFVFRNTAPEIGKRYESF